MVDDYLVDEDMASSLIPYAQNTVKLALNYPSTDDFSLFDWSYGREGSLYKLKSSEMDLESRMKFNSW